jgi:hypothetical protein
VLATLLFNPVVEINLAIRDAPADLDERGTLAGPAPPLERAVIHVGMQIRRGLALVEKRA